MDAGMKSFADSRMSDIPTRWCEDPAMKEELLQGSHPPLSYISFFLIVNSHLLPSHSRCQNRELLRLLVVGHSDSPPSQSSSEQASLRARVLSAANAARHRINGSRVNSKRENGADDALIE